MKQIILMLTLLAMAGCEDGVGRTETKHNIVCFTPNGDIMFNGIASRVSLDKYGEWFVTMDGHELSTNGVCFHQIIKIKPEPKAEDTET